MKAAESLMFFYLSFILLLHLYLFHLKCILNFLNTFFNIH